MTREERALILGLVKVPGKPESSESDFLNRFPVNPRIEPGYITRALKEASQNKDAVDFECAVILGSRFGFPTECADILRKVILEDWHSSHEDVVTALQKLNDPAIVDCLFKTALAKYAYRDYDESESLAVKCIWALKKIGTPLAKEKLKLLAQSDNSIIRQNAYDRLASLESRESHD